MVFRIHFVVLLTSLFCIPVVAEQQIPTSLACTNAESFYQKIVHLNGSLPSSPDSNNNLINLAMAYESIGMPNKGLDIIIQAENTSPNSGPMKITKVHLLHLKKQINESLSLATKVLENKENNYLMPRRSQSWLRHSILGIYLETGQLTKAELLILKLYPNVIELIDKKVIKNQLELGVPIHTLGALIHIYRATERGNKANSLAIHLKGFDAESLFEKKNGELLGFQHWMLASIWVVDPRRHSEVIDELEKSYKKGFLDGWRFNYAHHPVYWPLHNNRKFQKLINNIEKDMTKQRECLMNDNNN